MSEKNDTNQEPNFPLTKKQKIEFGELAIKKLQELFAGRFPVSMALDGTGPDSICFCGGRRDDILLYFYFKDNGLSCLAKPITCYNISGNLNWVVQPAYYAYMYKLYGEPFREAALAYQQKRSAEEYNEYQEYKATGKAAQGLDEKERDLLAKHNQIIDIITNLNSQEFQLTKAQKVEFCKQAIKKLTKLYPQYISTDLQLYVEEDPFSEGEEEYPNFAKNVPADVIAKTESGAPIRFHNESSGPKIGCSYLEVFLSTFNSRLFLNLYSGNDAYWKNVRLEDNLRASFQQIYLDYMCQKFGEPYRKAAMKHWQEEFAAERQQFQARRSEQIAQLDQQEQALLAKQNTLLDFLSKGTDKKLRHFAAPDMKLKGAGKTMNNAAKQALPQDNDREMI